MDSGFLEILACPVTGQRLRRLGDEALAELNRRIAAGEGKTVDGAPVERALEAGLVSEDGARVYPVRDGIPVLLAEEAVGIGVISP